MQMLGGQSLDDSTSLCMSSKAIQRKSVRYGAVGLVRCAVIRFFGELMCAFDVPIKVESESREIGGNRSFVWRNLMKPFEYFGQLCSVAPATINPAKIVKSFTARRRVFLNAEPEWLGLAFQLPFRS